MGSVLIHTMRIVRTTALLAAIALLLVIVTTVVAGDRLTHPVPTPIGAPPADLPIERVTVLTSAKRAIAGWLIPGVPHAGAVLVLHPVRTNRLAMLGRARLLHRLGYTVLLVDLQAHGESPGDRITFGARESAGVTAALTYLRDRFPSDRLGVIGVSLGAASLVLAKLEPPPDAVVLESMYATIDDAVANRLALHLGAWAAPLAPGLVRAWSWRVDVATDALRPIDAIGDLRAPLLIVAGSEDRHTTAAETARLFAAARPPKTLWMVEGAAHVDLLAIDPAAYEARVAPFLATHLRPRATPL